MIRKDLCRKTAAAAGVTIADAERVIQAAEKVIMDALHAGDNVHLIGFGKFEARVRAARASVAPQTGKRITIPGSKVPAFKAGKVFRDILNDRR